MTFTATILGAPVTKKNHQRIVKNKATGKPFILQSTAHGAWFKSAVPQLQAHRRGAWLYTDPVTLRAVFYRHKRVGDLGNYLAALCDALERAGIVANDRLIAAFDGCRLDHDPRNPRIELELRLMSEVDEPITRYGFSK